MDPQDQTLTTYNDSAVALAEYFAGHGPRTNDIEQALALAGHPSEPKVLELGCGDGRDAAEIIPRVASYIGIDPSAGMLALAQQKLPQARFVEADARSYDYPQDLDVIYAFASFLHISKEDLVPVFQKCTAALRIGGVLYLSLKERPYEESEIKRDRFGERQFFYYTVPELLRLVPSQLELISEDHHLLGKTTWLTMAFRKTT